MRSLGALLLAALLSWAVVVGVPWSLTLSPASMSADTGYAYIHPVTASWPWRLAADGPDAGNASSLRLLENGIDLGAAHAPHAQIRGDGGGRFSHWGEALWFSTSDGSDPRHNGRSYRLAGTVRLDTRGEVAALGLALALALGVLGQGKAWPRRPTPLAAMAEQARRLYPALGLYGLVVLVAYGPKMFTLTLAEDDWGTVVFDGYQYEWVVAIGRWLTGVIWRLAEDDAVAPAVTLSLLAGAYLYVALALSWCLGLTRPAAQMALALVLVTFPYNAEPFLLGLEHLPFAVGLVLSVSAGLMIIAGEEARSAGRWRAALGLGLVASVLFGLAAAIHQALIMFCVGAVLVRMLTLARPAGAVRAVLGLAAFAVVAWVGGLAVYAASVAVTTTLSGINPQTEGAFAVTASLRQSWADLGRGAGDALTVLGDLALGSHQLFPGAVQVAFVGVTVWVWGGYARGPRGGCSGRVAAIRFVIFAVVLALTLLAPLTIGMIRSGLNWRFNSLIALAIPHAAIIALMVERSRSRAALALAGAFVLVFAFQQNRAGTGTMVLNRRDLAIADHMLQTITADPGFTPFAARGVAEVAVVGDGLEGRLELGRPFAGKAHGVARFMSNPIYDCGLFNCEIHRLDIDAAIALIAEPKMTYRFRRWPNVPAAVAPAERDRLARRIATVHPWPAADAVIYGEGVIVLVLQPVGRGGN